MEATMKALIAAIIGASFLLGACNTVEGVGKDVKASGQKVEQEAKEHKRY
jgi:entericidin B